jgi:nitrate/nitrite-specific signal transduction histidine kinase
MPDLKKKKRGERILFATLMIVTQLCSMEIENAGQAANEAGRQRMLTQRILKDYAMVGMGNTFDNPKKDLNRMVATFEDHLESLRRFAKDPETQKSLEAQRTLWEPIKKMLQEPPTKERAMALQNRLDILLEAADRTARLFAKQTGKKSGELINLSGRQRMLSQRMAALYMLKVWGVDDPKFNEKLTRSMTLFEDSLDRLMQSDLNTPQIKTILSRVKKNFMFFKIMNRSRSKFIPSLIYKKSNDILKDMNTVTGLYASLEKA